MTITDAINTLEVIKFCDIDELAKIKAIDMAIMALREQESGNYNPKLTLEDLEKLQGKTVWWDINNSRGMWCMCRNGYVTTDVGTFSFGHIIKYGSVYLRMPDIYK